MTPKEEEVITLIRGQLEYCDIETTPMLCKMLMIQGNRPRLERAILEYIKEDGLTIAEAILQVERDHNPNMIDD